MPRKVRELVRDSKKAGWYLDRQKGSHRVHPKLGEPVSLSGADGDDAKNYEEKNVSIAIQNTQKAK
jgi:predicted RNA binding protein YcfA (HicA-like mRNA interferase family)